MIINRLALIWPLELALIFQDRKQLGLLLEDNDGD